MSNAEKKEQWRVLLAERTQPGRCHETTIKSSVSLGPCVLQYIARREEIQPYKLEFMNADWWSWDEVADVTDPEFKQKSWNSYDDDEDRKPAVYRGRLTSRIAQAVKTRLERQVSERSLSALGGLVMSVWSAEGHYKFDFANRIDWRRGDYADHGSCYWNGNQDAKRWLAEDDFLAIRFYAPPSQYDGCRSYGSGRGIGRAWLLFREYDGVRVPHVFNGYWEAGGDEMLNHDSERYNYATTHCSELAAQVLAHYLGVEHRPTTLTNRGDDSHVLYLNSSAGFIVCPPWLMTPSSVNLDTNNNRAKFPCAVCHQPSGLPALYDENTGKRVCANCFYVGRAKCDRCSQWVKTETLVKYGRYTLCPTCAQRYVWTCNGCQALFVKDDTRYWTGTDGGKYCRDCWVVKYKCCEWCGDTHLLTGLVFALGKSVCHYCADTRRWKCGGCGIESFDIYNKHGLTVEGNHQDMCYTCFKKLSFQCKICGERHHKTEGHWIIGSQALNAPMRRGRICTNCATNQGPKLTCGTCGRLALHDMITVREDGALECGLCRRDRHVEPVQPYTQCNYCGRHVEAPVQITRRYYGVRQCCPACAVQHADH